MPDGIHIGTFTIHFYGIIIMVGVLAAAFLASCSDQTRRAYRESLDDFAAFVGVNTVSGSKSISR